MTCRCTPVVTPHPTPVSLHDRSQCYGCTGCSTYPKQPCAFTGLQLQRGGAALPATWVSNPKPAQKLVCHEATTIVDASAVTFSFQ